MKKMFKFRLLNQNSISENLEKYQRLTYPPYRPILDNLQDSKYIAISAEDNQEILGLTIGKIDYKKILGKFCLCLLYQNIEDKALVISYWLP